VGFGETDPFEGRISDQSPVGKAINHKAVGDVVSVEVPAGVIELEIISIEKDKKKDQ
jgi:transcription elongation factor GreA